MGPAKRIPNYLLNTSNQGDKKCSQSKQQEEEVFSVQTAGGRQVSCFPGNNGSEESLPLTRSPIS